MKNTLKFQLLVLAILSTLWACCTPPPEYINEAADFGYYQKVGVVPFSNLTTDRNAADKVSSSFITALLMQGVVETASPGDFLKSFRDIVKGERVNLTEELSAEEVINLSKAAGVQGVFVGSVRDYGMTRVGSEEFPLISVVVRLLDGQSGKVVWSFETTRRGGPGFPVLSIGETHTLGDLTTKVCRQAAERFAAAVK